MNSQVFLAPKNNKPLIDSVRISQTLLTTLMKVSLLLTVLLDFSIQTPLYQSTAIDISVTQASKSHFVIPHDHLSDSYISCGDSLTPSNKPCYLISYDVPSSAYTSSLINEVTTTHQMTYAVSIPKVSPPEQHIYMVEQQPGPSYTLKKLVASSGGYSYSSVVSITPDPSILVPKLNHVVYSKFDSDYIIFNILGDFDHESEWISYKISTNSFQNIYSVIDGCIKIASSFTSHEMGCINYDTNVIIFNFDTTTSLHTYTNGGFPEMQGNDAGIAYSNDDSLIFVGLRYCPDFSLCSNVTEIFSIDASDATGYLDYALPLGGRFIVGMETTLGDKFLITSFLTPSNEGEIFIYDYSLPGSLTLVTMSPTTTFLRASSNYTSARIYPVGGGGGGYQITVSERIGNSIQVYNVSTSPPTICHANCDTCTGTTALPTDCLTCSHPRSFSSGSCPCLDGYFDNNDGTCTACNIACQTCTTAAATSCSVCRNGYSIDLATTSCLCEDGKFVDGAGICVACDSNCLTCSGTATNCDTCKTGDGFERTTGPYPFSCICSDDRTLVGIVCQLCASPCQKCQNGDVNSCTECDDPSLTLLNGDECLACGGKCDTCSGNPSNCDTCLPGLGLQIQGASPSKSCDCIAPTFQIGGTGLCSTCGVGCSSYPLSFTICDTCLSPFIKDNTNSKCICPPGQTIVSNTCQNCDLSCSTCEDAQPTHCSTCSAPNFEVDGTTFACLCPSATHNMVGSDCVLKIVEPPTPEEEEDKSEPLLLLRTYFNKEYERVTLKFNQKIDNSKKYQNFYTLDLSTPQSSMPNISLPILSSWLDEGDTSLNFQTSLSSLSFSSQKLYIFSQESGYPSTLQTNPNTFSDFPVTIQPVSYHSTSLDILVEESSKPINSSFKISNLATFFSSTNGYIALMKLFQILDFLHLLNIEVPRNVAVFFKTFKGDMMGMFPNPFQIETPIECNLNPIILEAEMECRLINNIGQIVVILSVLLLVKLIVMIGKYMMGRLFGVGDKVKEGANIVVRMIYWVVNFLESLTTFGKFVSIFVSLQIDIILAVAISIKAFTMKGVTDSGGLLISGFFGVFYFLIFCGYFIETIILIGSKKDKLVTDGNRGDNKQIIKGKNILKKNTRLLNSSIRVEPSSPRKRRTFLKKKSIFCKVKSRSNDVNESPSNFTAEKKIWPQVSNINLDNNDSHINDSTIINKNDTNDKKENDENAKTQKSDKINQISFKEFFEDINPLKRIGSFIIIINLFRDILIPFLIIFLIEYPYIQICSVVFFMGLKFIFLVITLPYISTWQNIKEIVSECLYIIVLLLYFALLHFGDSILEEIKYLVFGNLVMILIGLILILNLLDMLVTSLCGVIFMFRKIFFSSGSEKSDNSDNDRFNQITSKMSDSPKHDSLKRRKTNITESQTKLSRGETASPTSPFRRRNKTRTRVRSFQLEFANRGKTRSGTLTSSPKAGLSNRNREFLMSPLRRNSPKRRTTYRNVVLDERPLESHQSSENQSPLSSPFKINRNISRFGSPLKKKKPLFRLFSMSGNQTSLNNIQSSGLNGRTEDKKVRKRKRKTATLNDLGKRYEGDFTGMVEDNGTIGKGMAQLGGEKSKDGDFLEGLYLKKDHKIDNFIENQQKKGLNKNSDIEEEDESEDSLSLSEGNQENKEKQLQGVYTSKNQSLILKSKRQEINIDC